jgi:hypothetical protein
LDAGDGVSVPSLVGAILVIENLPVTIRINIHPPRPLECLRDVDEIVWTEHNASHLGIPSIRLKHHNMLIIYNSDVSPAFERAGYFRLLAVAALNWFCGIEFRSHGFP